MLNHSDGGLIRLLALFVVVGGLGLWLVSGAACSGPQVDLIGTVSGPCTEYAAQTATVEVTALDGEHLANGAVGRWVQVDPLTCQASISVDDVGNHDGYRVTVGELSGELHSAGTDVGIILTP